MLPGASLSTSTSLLNEPASKQTKSNNDTSVSKSGSSMAPKNLVRTDPRMQKLDKFLASTPDPNISNASGFHDSPSRIADASYAPAPQQSEKPDTSSGNRNIAVPQR